MLPRLLGRNYDERRLRYLLGLLFLALAVPTGALIWQAYGQLKWEAFHQYRNQAEELTRRIDAELAEAVSTAEARSSAEYSFLNVGGAPASGFLQRSPLSAYPVTQDMPGAIGYFQVDGEGRFSTPLLPTTDADSSTLGIGDAEFRERKDLADDIRDILSDNSLVEGRETAGARSQAEFDRLNEKPTFADEVGVKSPPAAREAEPEDAPAGQYAKVTDLKLDDALQKKSEIAEEEAQESADDRMARESFRPSAERNRRVEQAALPEPMLGASASGTGAEESRQLRITTFESEVEPFEFSLLGSGEFVLFRRVWRGDDRIVQGILIGREAFVGEAIVSAFRSTTLAQMSDLVVGFGDDVIHFEAADSGAENPVELTGMEGELLFRSRLSSPLDALELIFSVRHLPPGPGAAVLGWTTVLLAMVFGLGFLALYRLGLGQIRLARQQQDFVSSVSHELKTPLTSIRMYSEMLKEGWADEDRKRQYYAFIHDESERLSRLISNVLQLASITRNKPSFELKPVALGELIDRIRSKIASQVERSGFEIGIEVDPGSEDAVIEIDEDCVMQIVINLVDNAIKFSKDAEVRSIEITAGVDSDGRARLCVRDHGPGIPREQMKKVFRLFYRPRSELTRETVGTGIGLAIVHQLTLAMGGKVDVVNREPGAEFAITFPLAAD